MDTFTAFSTAPTNGGNSTSTIHVPGSSNPVLAFSTSGADQGNRSTPQQQQPPRVGSSMDAPLLAMTPSTMLFSTSATAMPNHNSNLNPSHLGTQFGTFHLSATLDTPADQFDDKAIESITQTLSVLQNIAEGRHLVLWDELLDPAHPQDSAREVCAALAKVPLLSRKEAIQSVARGIVSPQHLAIVNYLEEPYRNEVRDLVLQDLLGQLTRTGSEPMPVYAEMLAEFARLNLVRLSGVVIAIEQFLSQPDKRRAGLAVLGRMAENGESKESFLHAIQQAKRVESLLCQLYKDPQYEYDVVAITRMLGGDGSSSANAAAAAGDGMHTGNSSNYSNGTASLLCHGAMNTDSKAPVTVMQYFRHRDELVSGHGDGTVVVWGSPNAATGEVAPKLVLDLPNDCVPVAMSGPAKGQYLAVAGMPCPPSRSSLYRVFIEARRGSSNRMPAPASGAHPVIRVLGCHETTGNWASGETMVLPVGTTLTAIAALPNAVVCVGESSSTSHHTAGVVSGGGSGKGLLQHHLRFHNVTTGQPLHSIANAHSDYITALTAYEENEQVLFSGSRDRAIRLWDARLSSNSGGGNTSSGGAPMFMLDSGSVHQDTISAIYPFRSFVFTGSLDGSMCVWDTRRLTSPVASRCFISSVLDITALEGGRIAVATARGLNLVSLETMSAVDVLPNTVFTQLRCNDNGHVLFAAGQSGVNIFSLKK